MLNAVLAYFYSLGSNMYEAQKIEDDNPVFPPNAFYRLSELQHIKIGFITYNSFRGKILFWIDSGNCYISDVNLKYPFHMSPFSIRKRAKNFDRQSNNHGFYLWESFDSLNGLFQLSRLK